MRPARRSESSSDADRRVPGWRRLHWRHACGMAPRDRVRNVDGVEGKADSLTVPAEGRHCLARALRTLCDGWPPPQARRLRELQKQKTGAARTGRYHLARTPYRAPGGSCL